MVTDILEGSPAADAQLPKYSIITHINGNPINSKIDYNAYLETIYAGDKVNLSTTGMIENSQKLYELVAYEDTGYLDNYYKNIYLPENYHEYQLRNEHLWDFDHFSEMKSFVTKMKIDMRKIELFFEIHNCVGENRYFQISKVESDIKENTIYVLKDIELNEMVTIPKMENKEPTIFSFSICFERPLEYLILTGIYEKHKFKCGFKFEEFANFRTYVLQTVNLSPFNNSMKLLPDYYTPIGQVAKSEIKIDSPKFDEKRNYYTEDKSINIEGTVRDSFGINDILINNQPVNYIDKNGNFAHNLYLTIGKNEIEIVVRNIKQQEVSYICEVMRERVKTEKKIKNVREPIETDNHKPDDIAVVIGIENYSKIPDAIFASADASVVHDYLISTFGLKEENIKYLTDGEASKASFDEIFSENGWLSAYSTENSNIYIYYSGHGYVDENGDTYLIPYNASLDFLGSAYRTDTIYERVSELNAKSKNIILDACFSGFNKDGSTISTKRMVRIEKLGPPEDINLFTSCSSKELSNIYNDANQGLYTYYLLWALQGEADSNKDNMITYQEMDDFLKTNVSKKSKQLYGNQNPQLFSNNREEIFLDLGVKNEN